MSDLIPRIQALAAAHAAETVAIRQHLHAHPELSFEEVNTAAFVTRELEKLGLKPQPLANTGVVALIEGLPGGPTIALRADMDALPIREANDVPYKSTKPGVMHACGHDVHTASLLGVARILNELKGEFQGTIKLMFQPGEERLPGGASQMIKEGVLENPKVENVLGQHVFPHLAAGKIGVRSGRYMASTDELYLTIKGKGGHGAMPEMNLDPVLVAAHIIVAAQQIVSRRANPKIPSVLSFGKVIANGATNVIPNEVYMEGTFRTLNEEWRAEAHQHLRRLCEGLAESMGAVCELEIRHGYVDLRGGCCGHAGVSIGCGLSRHSTGCGQCQPAAAAGTGCANVLARARHDNTAHPPAPPCIRAGTRVGPPWPAGPPPVVPGHSSLAGLGRLRHAPAGCAHAGHGRRCAAAVFRRSAPRWPARRLACAAAAARPAAHPPPTGRVRRPACAACGGRCVHLGLALRCGQ